MKTLPSVLALILLVTGCDVASERGASPAPSGEAAVPAARKPVSNVPPLDPHNIVSIAINSADHSTLVAALKAADYVTGVSNPGPLTVFAPTNAAFDLLPPGTLDMLLKAENVGKLRHVLQHHVVASVYSADLLRDGDVLGMVDGNKVTISRKAGKVMVGDATIVASVRASNGIVHVIDRVLVPTVM